MVNGKKRLGAVVEADVRPETKEQAESLKGKIYYG